MACLTDGDLFAVQHSQDAVEACRLPFVGEFPNVSNMVHDNWLECLSTDAAGTPKLGARSHPRCNPYQIDIEDLSALECLSFFRPVMVPVE
jgi:hypothetical protein